MQTRKCRAGINHTGLWEVLRRRWARPTRCEKEVVSMAGKNKTDPNAERTRSLDAVMSQIEKQHGKGAVMRLGDDTRPPIATIPTGSIALDVALGLGGLPRGRVIEVYGPESSGKTTVALHAVANAQKAGGIAAFIDAEHALDPEYAKKLGDRKSVV